MIKKLISLIFLITSFCTAYAGGWLHIFYSNEGKFKVISNATADIDSIYYLPSTNGGNGFSSIAVQSSVSGLRTALLEEVDTIFMGSNLPTIYIQTDPDVSEIPDKTNYLEASFRFIPYDTQSDTIIQTVGIRGRGNTTWNYPKKPYRLKFDKKQSIGVLPKAKSFVLLANYLDKTLLKNAIAFKMAELLGMPYSNISIPVNLVLNGSYRGSYQLTNKVGINSGSVDIDEKEGILWELDTNYDEDYKFVTSPYMLPAMVKDPDLMELADGDSIKAAKKFEFWESDLNKALQDVSDGKWEEAFDIEQIVSYLMVFNLTFNQEICHPKSVYLYKENPNSKYKFGPVWDFDWSMGYNTGYDGKLFFRSKNGYDAYDFFTTIMKSESFIELYEKKYSEFKESGLSELMDFIDQYHDAVRISAYQDASIWTTERLTPTCDIINKEYFDENIEEIKQWILNRVEAMDASSTYLLY